MYPAKPLYAKVVMNMLIVILTSASVLGNGFVLAVLVRFKSLRTVPNILVGNLALVDLLNAAMNLPFHMMSILEVSWFRGKTLAIITVLIHRVFITLNLTSMLAMLANVYLGIAFDFKYFTWKTTKKALVGVFLIWFINFLMLFLFAIPLLDINLHDAHVNEYRAEIFNQGKSFAAALVILFILCGGALGFLTTRAIKKKNKKVYIVTYISYHISWPYDQGHPTRNIYYRCGNFQTSENFREQNIITRIYEPLMLSQKS